MSYELKIDPKKRAVSRFIGKVRKALVMAASDEKEASGLTQKDMADAIGVNRSVITRMLRGESNLTLRSIGEVAWALGYEPEFALTRRVVADRSNHVLPERPVKSLTRPTSPSTTTNVVVYARTKDSEPHSSTLLQVAE